MQPVRVILDAPPNNVGAELAREGVVSVEVMLDVLPSSRANLAPTDWWGAANNVGAELAREGVVPVEVILDVPPSSRASLAPTDWGTPPTV